MQAEDAPARELHVRCAWCGRYRLGDAWRDTSTDDRDATHGVCPDCFRILVGHLRSAAPFAGF